MGFFEEVAMPEFDSVDAILDFAIGEEESAAAWYTELSARMDKPWMKEVFAEFAQEEWGHKRKLLDVKQGRLLEPSRDKVLDLKLADYLVDREPSADMDFQEALILAMKAEKKSFRLYTDLAGRTDDAALRDTFLGLAQEEARHKLRFEIEYDDHVLREN